MMKCQRCRAEISLDHSHTVKLLVDGEREAWADLCQPCVNVVRAVFRTATGSKEQR
jgi:hypothetical protein